MIQPSLTALLGVPIAQARDDDSKPYRQDVSIDAANSCERFVYRVDVDWIESAAFEVLLIDSLSHYKRVDAAYNWMKKNYPGMCRRLKFKMVW